VTTPARNDAPTADASIVVELDDAIELLMQEASGRDEERAARSLFQTSTLGTVVTAIRELGVVHNDQPDEPATIQGLRGECVVSLDGQDSVVKAGTFVGVPAGVRWRLIARTDAVVLLTLTRT
jgi:quercetin dioxygenase-like cupin family protein